MNRSYPHPRLQAEKSLYILAGFGLVLAAWAYVARLEISLRGRGVVRVQGEAVRIVLSVGGRITHVYAAEGKEVRSGDPLIQLDTSRLTLKQRMLKSRVHLTQLQLSSLQSRLDSAAKTEEQSVEAERLELEAAVSYAKTAVDRAQQHLVRTRQLFAEGLVSGQVYDDAISALALARAEQARAGSHSIELRKFQAQARLRDLALELTPVRAELAALQEQLEQVRQEIVEMTVTSPADGQITALGPLHAGEVVSSGTMIGSLVPQPHRLVIESWLPSPDRAFVNTGQGVRLESEVPSAEQYNSFGGVVLSISPDAKFSDSLNGVYRVLIEPAPGSQPLHLGMTLQVHFIEREERLLGILFRRVRKFIAL